MKWTNFRPNQLVDDLRNTFFAAGTPGFLRLKYLIVPIVGLVVLSLLTIPSNVNSAPLTSAPYSSSNVITGITWEPVSNVISLADGSDTWPITWADDGDLYTAFGDGKGFTPNVPDKLSLGFAKVSGTPPNMVGTNFRSPTGEQLGNGASGKKASGILMVDGTLYMWVRNVTNDGQQCQLAWSSDRGLTWDWSNWKFTELGYCALLNFGQNYAGARDNYVYMYSPDTPSAYNETDQVVLTRVNKNQITDKSAYEFFQGLDGSVDPIWTSDIAQRGSVFSFPGKGANRLDVTYNEPLGLYMMTMRSRSRDGGLNQFSIYESPEPWGPWSTVYYTEEWEGGSLPGGNGGWGESQHIPSKWISSDGTSFYMVYAGNDSFAVRKATLTIASSVPTATPTPVPTSTPAPTATPAPVPTSTPVPTATSTPIPTPTCPTFPGNSSPSQDLDADGKCEDVNGNGRVDFNDVVEFLLNLPSMQADNSTNLDFNGNQRVDMDDIVQLYNILISSIP